VFSNLNWYNVIVLLLLALFIFGDKLPQMISDGLKLLRNVRRMAQNATTDLSRELGTDIRLEDLHPKAFVRKHLLSEDDQEALTRPLRDLSEDVTRQTSGLRDEAVRGNGAGRPAGAAREGAPQPGIGADGGESATAPRPRFDDVT
jgi:sec-independent protein translocase protein TatB